MASSGELYSHTSCVLPNLITVRTATVTCSHWRIIQSLLSSHSCLFHLIVWGRADVVTSLMRSKGVLEEPSRYLDCDRLHKESVPVVRIMYVFNIVSQVVNFMFFIPYSVDKQFRGLTPIQCTLLYLDLYTSISHWICQHLCNPHKGSSSGNQPSKAA
jgi:hypothetical protein